MMSFHFFPTSLPPFFSSPSAKSSSCGGASQRSHIVGFSPKSRRTLPPKPMAPANPPGGGGRTTPFARASWTRRRKRLRRMSDRMTIAQETASSRRSVARKVKLLTKKEEVILVREEYGNSRLAYGMVRWGLVHAQTSSSGTAAQCSRWSMMQRQRDREQPL